MSWSAVADIQDQYGANLGAVAIIALAQVALLGNAATWALSFLAGPGFQVALGSTISAGAAQPGLLPLVPVLGALPQASDYPATMYAVVLAPVLVGVWLGRRVDAELEFFGNVRARLSATAVAALIAVVVVVALTALGNGAVGVDRLSAVGAAPLVVRGGPDGRGRRGCAALHGRARAASSVAPSSVSASTSRGSRRRPGPDAETSAPDAD